MTEMIVNGIGCIVVFAGGITLAGLLLGAACNYAWRKLCDANELRKVLEIVRDHNANKEVLRG